MGKPMDTNSERRKEGWIFRPWIRLKSGRIIYAKDYGKRCFRIPIN